PRRQLEAVVAAASHVEDLVLEHLPHRAQLASVLIAIPQQAPNGVATAVGELGELHADQREMTYVLREVAGVLIALQAHAEASAARAQRGLVSLEAREADADVTVAREGVVVP